jgi:hypothetical protein
VIRVEDLYPYLRYWIDVMTNPSRKWKDESFYAAMDRFIQEYRYDGVAQLVRDFNAIQGRIAEPPTGRRPGLAFWRSRRNAA